MSDTDDRSPPEEIGCLEAIEALYAYLDGEVRDPLSLAQIEHHLGHCRSCYSRAELERALTQHLRKSVDRDVPESLQVRLRRLLDGLGPAGTP